MGSHGRRGLERMVLGSWPSRSSVRACSVEIVRLPAAVPIPTARSIEQLPRELDKGLHVGQIRRQSERHAHGAGALAVDAQPEIVDGEMRLVLWPAEARGQFGAGNSQRDFPAAWITEAAGAQ